MAKRKTKRIEPRFAAGGPGEIALRPGDRAGGRRSRGQKRGQAGRSAPRGLLSRLVRFGVYWGLVLALWGGVAVAGVVAYYGLQLPHASTWKVPARPPNVQIVAVDGSLIGNRGDTGGEAVRLADLPDYVPNAVIAIEDRRFRSHFALDPLGLTRAIARNALAGRLVEGGSTLTQQLAKNLFLTPERSLGRKVQEVLLAFWLETKYSKDQILEMYLNRVYFGAGAYGIDAAAHRYFDKDAADLDIAEAAMLAGLLKAPSSYAPNRYLERARARAALVVDAMAEEGFIGSKQAALAKAQPASLAARQADRSENYVADWVMDRLPSYVGNLQSDIVVQTTIDLGLQHAAESALVKGLDAEGGKYGVSQGALVALDGTGAVRALVGGRNYARSQYNRAVQARRQPGSAFKPFVYLAALESGMTPGTIRVDEPVRFGKWAPENYSRSYRGPVSLKTALAFSINTIAAKLAVEIGPKRVVETAHRLGIESELSANASIALGTSEVSLLELTSAYAPFANGGFAVTPHVVQDIRTGDGKVLFRRPGPGIARSVDLRSVAMMNEMLAETLTAGTGKSAGIPGWPAAGKTGTSQDFRDAWFIGYTSNLTAGVWLGNDDNHPTRKASGGTLPAEIWTSFMVRAHEGVPPAPLPGTALAPMIAAAEQQRPPVQAASVRQEAPAGRADWPVSRGEETGRSGGRTIMDLIFGR
ncbi:transglycosylase domain-containing protein [Propylenella binzhouense]|uniref:Penicillin-binding protein 1A n=1 Tax=Propylenella binzhouense TaxID=2555902 RepID=A0A964T327_9HYPH|nr:penicillin-binding protein 1A [Propylenella binzhouense]MYZ47394.1 penicillin-binding protein 1A [Propylenella binzhouense]